MDISFNRISNIPNMESALTGSRKELHDRYVRNQAQYVNQFYKPLFRGILANTLTGETYLYE